MRNSERDPGGGWRRACPSPGVQGVSAAVCAGPIGDAGSPAVRALQGRSASLPRGSWHPQSRSLVSDLPFLARLSGRCRSTPVLVAPRRSCLAWHRPRLGSVMMPPEIDGEPQPRKHRRMTVSVAVGAAVVLTWLAASGCSRPRCRRRTSRRGLWHTSCDAAQSAWPTSLGPLLRNLADRSRGGVGDRGLSP
jgi:hypothetical protein